MKTVFITGATSGIGKATVLALAAIDYEIVFSYFMFSILLSDLLEKSDDPRVVNVSSGAHASGEFDPGNFQSEKKFSPFGTYRNTKLLNILFTIELAERFKDKGITVNALHPGVIRTNFGSEFKGIYRFFGSIVKLFLISAKKGAETTVFLASSEEVKGVTGKYYIKCKPAETNNAAITIQNRKILWDQSEVLST